MTVPCLHLNWFTASPMKMTSCAILAFKLFNCVVHQECLCLTGISITFELRPLKRQCASLSLGFSYKAVHGKDCLADSLPTVYRCISSTLVKLFCCFCLFAERCLFQGGPYIHCKFSHLRITRNCVFQLEKRALC